MMIRLGGSDLKMDVKEIQYLFEGISNTLGGLSGELYATLVAKGKKRMGQEDAADTPQVSELIKRTREKQTVAELISKGQKGQEELIQSIGGEVKKILSSAGIVTKSDLARVERRVDEIDKALGKGE
jgi:polyhydroxyalkanoate synthesis regulator phasin